MSVRKTLCRFDEIPDGGATSVEVGTVENPDSIILLRRGSSVRAYRNECPHTGRRLDWAPGRFLIEGDQIICAAHGACFFIASGLCNAGPPRGQSLMTVAIEVVDGDVLLV